MVFSTNSSHALEVSLSGKMYLASSGVMYLMPNYGVPYAMERIEEGENHKVNNKPKQGDKRQDRD